MQDRSQYSAAASLLGYIYQCRLALLESLKRLKSDPDIAVAIETLDDVVFEYSDRPHGPAGIAKENFIVL
jgi:hypothetical protein